MQARRKDVATSLWENARTRARKNGLPFTITVEDVRAVWPQDARCPALGLRMQRGRGVMRAASPTLDRLVPAFGYVPGNIAVLCAKANIAKSAATAEELRRIAAWMNLAGLN